MKDYGSEHMLNFRMKFKPDLITRPLVFTPGSVECVF